MRRPSCILAAAAILLLAAPARAQRVFVPVESGDGLVWTDDEPRPFQGSLRIHPAVGLAGGAVRVGPTGAFVWTNPGTSWQVGAHAAVRLASLRALGRYPFAEVRLGAEALWGDDDRRLIGGVLTLALNRVLHVVARGGYDRGIEAAYAEAGIGTDLGFWLGVRPPRGRATRIDAPFEGCQAEVFGEAKVQAQALLGRRQDLVAPLGRFLDVDAATFVVSESFDAAQMLAARRGLVALAATIPVVVDYGLGHRACGGALDLGPTLEAILEAWSQAHVAALR